MSATQTDLPLGYALGGRFTIRSLLGRGGMAAVYLADDESLGRTVAVKVFRPDLADGDDIRRQQEEITMLAGLNHPGLVTLFDAATDEASGFAYLVMEFVPGNDLRTRLRDGALAPMQVAAIGSQMSDALAYVHTLGIVHRDIKPANILLRDGEHTGPVAKLADFGIARIADGTRLTATGTVLGTASYFSPEQAAGEAITPASDIYSLGLVLLECLTGSRAFPGSALESMMARIARDPEIPDHIGPAWSNILARMTSRLPEDRPSALQVSEELSEIGGRLDATLAYPAVPPAVALAEDTAPVEDTTDATVDDSPTKRETLPRSRRRVGTILASIATVVLLGWLAVFAVTNLSQQESFPDEPGYPAVEGPLGSHLEQLQRTVAP